MLDFGKAARGGADRIRHRPADAPIAAICHGRASHCHRRRRTHAGNRTRVLRGGSQAIGLGPGQVHRPARGGRSAERRGFYTWPPPSFSSLCRRRFSVPGSMARSPSRRRARKSTRSLRRPFRCSCRLRYDKPALTARISGASRADHPTADRQSARHAFRHSFREVEIAVVGTKDPRAIASPADWRASDR